MRIKVSKEEIRQPKEYERIKYQITVEKDVEDKADIRETVNEIFEELGKSINLQKEKDL